jgi:hypothetical protein
MWERFYKIKYNTKIQMKKRDYGVEW